MQSPVHTDLFSHSMSVVGLGARVQLADGRTGVVKRLSPKGVVELVNAIGGFVCISHVDCVRVVIAYDDADHVFARSASEDERVSGEAAAGRNGAQLPNGNHGDNQSKVSR